MTIADVLERAAELLSRPGAWTQGTLFRDAKGKELQVSSAGKSCFCMAGALVECGGPWSAAWSFLDDILPKADKGNATAAFNDASGRTQDEVVAKLREAAALARGEVS